MDRHHSFPALIAPASLKRADEALPDAGGPRFPALIAPASLKLQRRRIEIRHRLAVFRR